MAPIGLNTLNSTDPVAGRSFSVDSRGIGSAWAENSQDELTLPHPTVPMDGYVSEDSSLDTVSMDGHVSEDSFLEKSPEDSESGHNTSVADIAKSERIACYRYDINSLLDWPKQDV